MNQVDNYQFNVTSTSGDAKPTNITDNNIHPDNKVHGANLGPTWVLLAWAPMNFVTWALASQFAAVNTGVAMLDLGSMSLLDNAVYRC